MFRPAFTPPLDITDREGAIALRFSVSGEDIWITVNPGKRSEYRRILTPAERAAIVAFITNPYGM